MRNASLISLLAITVASAVALAGCGSAKDTTREPTAGSSITATASDHTVVKPAAPPTPVAQARHEAVQNDLFDFAYSYPAEVAAIPTLKAQFDDELDKAKAEITQSTKEEKAMATKEDFPFRPHSLAVKWSVVANLADWLSLSSQYDSYTGGAHGLQGFDSMVWDRRTQTRLKALDFFTSEAAFRQALQMPFCAAIDKERAKRRGEPVDRRADGLFNDCIDPAAQTIILGSAGKKAFDRIGILVGPYEAGPYVEGTYEVTLPVTKAILAAVKPQYRDAFSIPQ